MKWCQLPQEMREYIIDCACYDFPTLLSCSLTCSSLLDRSRSHIFRAVDLRSAINTDRYAQFEALLDAWRNISSINPATHANDHAISHYARDVTIDCARPTTPGDGGVLRILPKLGRVERLTLQDCVSSRLLLDWNRDLSAYFPNVQSLHLLRGAYDGRMLRRILLACPKLRAVHFINVKVEHIPEETPRSESNHGCGRSHEVKLDTLALGYVHPVGPALDTSLPWLLQSPFKLCLKRLELTWSPAGKSVQTPLWITAHELLSKMSASLEELVLLHSESHICGAPSDLFDLTANTRLRSLKLCVPWIEEIVGPTAASLRGAMFGFGAAEWIRAFCKQIQVGLPALPRLSRVEVELKIRYSASDGVWDEWLEDRREYWDEIREQLTAIINQCNADRPCGSDSKRVQVVLRINFEVNAGDDRKPFQVWVCAAAEGIRNMWHHCRRQRRTREYRRTASSCTRCIAKTPARSHSGERCM